MFQVEADGEKLILYLLFVCLMFQMQDVCELEFSVVF